MRLRVWPWRNYGSPSLENLFFLSAPRSFRIISEDSRIFPTFSSSVVEVLSKAAGLAQHWRYSLLRSTPWFSIQRQHANRESPAEFSLLSKPAELALELPSTPQPTEYGRMSSSKCFFLLRLFFRREIKALLSNLFFFGCPSHAGRLFKAKLNLTQSHIIAFKYILECV